MTLVFPKNGTLPGLVFHDWNNFFWNYDEFLRWFSVFWGNSQNISGSKSDIQQTDIETEMDSNTDVPVKDDIENSKVTL